MRNFSKGCAACASAIEADEKRVRAELRDRIDACREVGLDFEDIVRALADKNPDLVREALDDMGAPE